MFSAVALTAFPAFYQMEERAAIFVILSAFNIDIEKKGHHYTRLAWEAGVYRLQEAVKYGFVDHDIKRKVYSLSKWAIAINNVPKEAPRLAQVGFNQ
jgi:hypothetical protein